MKIECRSAFCRRKFNHDMRTGVHLPSGATLISCPFCGEFFITVRMKSSSEKKGKRQRKELSPYGLPKSSSQISKTNLTKIIDMEQLCTDVWIYLHHFYLCAGNHPHAIVSLKAKAYNIKLLPGSNTWNNLCQNTNGVIPKRGITYIYLKEGSLFEGVRKMILKLFLRIICTVIVLFVIPYLYVENRFRGFYEMLCSYCSSIC